jgi:hypothetical protein
MMMAADPDAPRWIAAGIGPLEGGRFRWTGKAPQVKLAVPNVPGLKLRARFWVAADALKANGPLEIRYLLNGREVDRVRYATQGEQVFEKPVEAGLLLAGTNVVGMELDKVYEQNGAQLGVALAELGFTD